MIAVLFALLLMLPMASYAACTGASPTWTCTADYTSLNDLLNNNIPGTVLDGDTVNVTQTGSVTWNSRLDIANKSISFIGPGSNNLTITGGAAGVAAMRWTTKATGSSPAGFTRLSGFTFTQSAGAGCQILANGTSGSVNFAGSSSNVRIDHVHFKDVQCGTLHVYGNVRGVVDHNTFENISAGGSHSTNIEHDSWQDVGSYGDKSWASISTWGSTDQLVFEDNILVNSNPGTNFDGVYATNDSVGARTTYRFNTWTNNTYQTHGTETNGRARGQRHTEFYRNNMTWNRFGILGSIIAYRGGTMRTWDNKITDLNGWISRLITFSSVRHRNELIANYFPWGACGRITITSITSSGTVATATFSGDSRMIHNNAGFVTISGANEAKYNGTFLIKGSSWGGISSNQFQFTVDSAGATTATGTIVAVSPFDGNTDAEGYPCMDQAGRGQGALLSGDISSNPPGGSWSAGTLLPNPPVWAGNALEPIYAWNNIKNATLGSGTPANATSPIIVANRDYYNETSPFSGSSGIGRGLRSARPATCTTGTAYWATDGGGNWNTSTTETYSALVGYSSGADGALDMCTATNTWTSDYYVPLAYPHPLISGVASSTASAVITFPTVGSSQTASSSISVAGTASAGSGALTRVDVYLDGVLACSDTVASFSPWGCSITAPGTPGVYTLTARATDAIGQGPVSAGVSFLVPGGVRSSLSGAQRFRGLWKVQ